MIRVARAVAWLEDRIATAGGVEIGFDPLDRGDSIALAEPGAASANGSARLIRAADGWLAVNLPREDDWTLASAWLGGEPAGWDAIAERCGARTSADLVAAAGVLGLAVARVGEARPVPIFALGPPERARPEGLRVLDLSALWAGPLCGAILAKAGCAVTRAADPRRPDPSPAPLRDRLNGAKRTASIDFRDADALREAMLEADMVITSARKRAFAVVSPEAILAARPDLIWIAISGHGWNAEPDRIGFGDDCAAAGGLVAWEQGAPRFLGDALADPLTGLAAAAAALDAIAARRGGLIDMALAGVAAAVAAC